MDILKKIIIFIIVNLELRLKSASDYKMMCTKQFEATNNKKAYKETKGYSVIV